MSVRIRLRRVGRKKQPSYRIVVANSSTPRGGVYIENVGFYNPRQDPIELRVNMERIDHWIENGAVLSPTVASLVRKVRRGEISSEPAAQAEPKAAKAAKAEPAPKAEKAPKAEAAPKAEEAPKAEAAPAAEEEPKAEAAAEEPKAEAAAEAPAEAVTEEPAAEAEGAESEKPAED